MIGFHLRSHQLFLVEDSFPNIVPDNLNNGVSEVTYSLDLNVCTDYIASWDDAVNTLKGGILIEQS